MSLPTTYLTFDDGPVPSTTAKVLDLLDSVKLPATFFINMNKMASRPEEQRAVLSRILKSKLYSLGNHGYDHQPTTLEEYRQDWNKHGTREVRKDFELNLEKLRALFKDTATFKDLRLPVARLPGDGRRDKRFVEMITRELRLPNIIWDIDIWPEDVFVRRGALKNWKSITGLTADINNRRKDFVEGSIILAHDKHWSTDKRLDILKQFLLKLKKETRVTALLPLPSGNQNIQYAVR